MDEHRSIAKKINQLKKADLELRNQLIQRGELGNGYNEEMKDLHNRHADILDGIINKIGYPTIDIIGQEAYDASWFVIQHAIERPAFMKKCLKLLEQAVKEKKANPLHLAFLNDRIAVFEGKTQRYGSQFDWDENGEMSPQPIDDIQLVNERRKSIGLNTLEEQTQMMRRRAADENQSPPTDWNKRKQEMENWRIAVGWTK